jgi:uncharacterized protein
MESNAVSNAGRSLAKEPRNGSVRRAVAGLTLLISAGVFLAAHAATAQTPQTPYPGGVWQPTPATFAAAAAKDVTVKMDDGVALRASVFYPADRASGRAADGRFPVILEMTPYVFGAANPQAAYFVERGYIYVVVRPRGTAGSEGEVQQFSSRDGLDGKAVVDWAAKTLAGSDGRIGLLGCSYPGATGLATAAQVGPDSPVKAAISACIGLDMQHRQVWTTNGLPNAALSAYAPSAAMMMGNAPSVTKYFNAFYEGVMAGGPEAYDGYWKDRLPLEWARRIVQNKVPVLLWVGWGDINEIGAIHAYAALQNSASGRPFYAPMSDATTVTPRYQLIVGNWGHGQGLDPGVQLQWFETWLKGIDTGIGRTSTPMHLFEQGTNRWINVARYPLVAEYTKWFLASDTELAGRGPTGEKEASLAWADPEAPGARLRFDTPPFADGATLAGPISATVYARSSNTNMELLAKLYDVAPDGTSTRVTTGGLLGSQRTLNKEWSWTDRKGTVIWPWPTLENDEYLTPGQAYRLEIPLAARQWGIAPGHRLRLELTTQSPASVCPPTGRVSLVSEPCKLTAPQQKTLPGGTYTILYGPQHPSTLNLPQVAPNALPSVPAGRTPTAPGGPGPAATLPLDWGRK